MGNVPDPLTSFVVPNTSLWDMKSQQFSEQIVKLHVLLSFLTQHDKESSIQSLLLLQVIPL